MKKTKKKKINTFKEKKNSLKKTRISESKYNPKIKVIPQENVIKNNGENITINVIRDDLIDAGTKQRAMVPFFQNSKYDEFVYVSPYTGAAQVSLAYSAKMTGKKVTVFMYKIRPQHPLTKKALKLASYNKKYLNLIEIKNGNMKYLEKLANSYVERKKREKGDNYITKIGLGFANEEYKNLLIEKIKNAIPKKLQENPPKRIWVPSGSSIMLNALYEVFPASYFLAVQTGKTIWDDMYNKKNTKLYKSDEFFYDKAKIQPPYPTTTSYDAKAWKFILEDGEDQDYIWNITSEISLDAKKTIKHISNSNKIDYDNIFKFDRLKPTYKKFKDDNYEFDYCNINYINNIIDPYLEFLRNKEKTSIINYILYIIKKEKISLKSGNKSILEIITSNLAMWMAVNLMDKYNLVDPFFPYKFKNSASYNKEFINTFVYLSNGKITKLDANKLFNKFKLNKLFNNACIKIYNASLNIKNNKTYIKHITKSDNIDLELYFEGSDDLIYSVNCKKNVYEHLKNRFMLDTNELDKYVFCLLLRYKSFMGNSHQFAMETKFKDVLREKYGINFECFASPINVYYDKYCSLFYDIEKHFGSYGSFYLMKYIRGFYIANPPYENYMLELMVNKFIESCKKSSKPLSISFGLPNWGKYDKFKAMEIVKEAKETKFIRCMKDGEVWWYDKLNNARIKIPSHCRCIVQNEKGETTCNIKEFNNLIDNYWK